MDRLSSTMRLPAEVERLPEAMAFVETQSEAAGVSPAKISGLCLALEEAFVNICTYAFKGGPGEVTLTCFETAAAFILEIADTGPEFNQLSVPEPDLSIPLEQRRIGGLGVHFIRKFTDHVDWRREDNMNMLRLSINLNREKPHK